MAKVSVVVPIYNAGEKLHKCIKSILTQTFSDFELILVNDGSKDKSLLICNKYQNEDKRIIVINKNNEGCIIARRTGIEASTSEYVMFVDADDWIHPKTIETLYHQIKHNKVDITVCNMYKVLGKGMIKRKAESSYFKEDKIYHEEDIKKILIPAYFHGHAFPSSLCAKLYKRELLVNSGKYLKRIYFLGEDLFYNLEILLRAKTLKVIDQPLYYYRYGGFTNKYQNFLFDDMINGYLIQKEVIDEYFQNTVQTTYNGISIMLLNTFKTCLCNLFAGNFNASQIKTLIQTYITNDIVLECTSNKGSMNFFPAEYLNSIRNMDIEYLYDLGQRLYKRARPRKILINILSRVC